MHHVWIKQQLSPTKNKWLAQLTLFFLDDPLLRGQLIKRSFAWLGHLLSFKRIWFCRWSVVVLISKKINRKLFIFIVIFDHFCVFLIILNILRIFMTQTYFLPGTRSYSHHMAQYSGRRRRSWLRGRERYVYKQRCKFSKCNLGVVCTECFSTFVTKDDSIA